MADIVTRNEAPLLVSAPEVEADEDPVAFADVEDATVVALAAPTAGV